MYAIRSYYVAVIDEFLVEFKQRIFAEAFDPALSPMQRIRKLAELAYRFQKDVAEETGQTLGCPFGTRRILCIGRATPVPKQVCRFAPPARITSYNVCYTKLLR